MGAQRLSNKTCRRIARITGQEILRGWAYGGYYYEFVTPDHKHGRLNIKNNEWEWIENPTHFNSCYTDWGKDYRRKTTTVRPYWRVEDVHGAINRVIERQFKGEVFDLELFDRSKFDLSNTHSNSTFQIWCKQSIIEYSIEPYYIADSRGRFLLDEQECWVYGNLWLARHQLEIAGLKPTYGFLREAGRLLREHYINRRGLNGDKNPEKIVEGSVTITYFGLAFTIALFRIKMDKRTAHAQW